jgi:tetratricopeptide (TPR) repeat protein
LPNDKDTIRVFFAAALTSFPQTYNDYMRKGADAFNKGELQYSIRAYEDAVRANPSDPLGTLHLAFVLLRQEDASGSWDRVRKLSFEVLQVDPRNDNAEWNLALLDTLNRNPTGAKSHCATLLSRQPSHAGCLFAAALSSWTAVFPQVMEARRNAGMEPSAVGPIPNPIVREALHKQFDTEMRNGLDQLSNLRQMHPEHMDAAAYQNLIQRTRASFAPSENDSRALITDADRFLTEALALRGEGEPMAHLYLDPRQLPPMAEMPKRMAPPPPPPPAR